MAADLSSVKNLLIDLGGVLYQIDIPSTLASYQNLLPAHMRHAEIEKLLLHPAFKSMDRGKITIEELADTLIKEWELEVETKTIKQIWLDLLVGLYPGRTEMMEALGQRHQLALLSNTSRYHYEHYKTECWNMFSHMDHLFFSFELGMIKPNPQIYAYALEKMDWKAEETLFLDDSVSNIEGAKALGIQTLWIEKAEIFEEFVEQMILKNPS